MFCFVCVDCDFRLTEHEFPRPFVSFLRGKRFGSGRGSRGIAMANSSEGRRLILRFDVGCCVDFGSGDVVSHQSLSVPGLQLNLLKLFESNVLADVFIQVRRCITCVFHQFR